VSDSEFDTNDFPLAYLITVRSYGTWLHGDERLTVDRHGLNVYGRRRRAPNENLRNVMRQNMSESTPMVLNEIQRANVKDAINEVCNHRGYDLRAVNVLTNHFHVVVSAQSKPEPIANAFKSYATRKLREAGLIGDEVRPWARGKSRRYLWKPKHVSRAIEYVLYGQGDIPDFDD
jgi:REP element-mobilizing transposase RayT